MRSSALDRMLLAATSSSAPDATNAPISPRTIARARTRDAEVVRGLDTRLAGSATLHDEHDRVRDDGDDGQVQNEPGPPTVSCEQQNRPPLLGKPDFRGRALDRTSIRTLRASSPAVVVAGTEMCLGASTEICLVDGEALLSTVHSVAPVCVNVPRRGVEARARRSYVKPVRVQGKPRLALALVVVVGLAVAWGTTATAGATSAAQRCASPRGPGDQAIHSTDLRVTSITCAVGRKVALTCHRFSYGHSGTCSAAGYRWRCTSTKPPGSKSAEKCLSSRRSMSITWTD
jgi:hypothetical protein